MTVVEAIKFLTKYPKDRELILTVNSTATGFEECLSQLNVPIESISLRGDGKVSITSSMIIRNSSIVGDKNELPK